MPEPKLVAAIARHELKKMEQEANRFAMELLMPLDSLKADIKKMGGIDIENDDAVTKLARRYQVSTQMMTLRLGEILFADRKAK